MKKRILTVFTAVVLLSVFVCNVLLAGASEKLTLEEILDIIASDGNDPDADINKDGEVNVLDAILAARRANGSGLSSLTAGDYTLVPEFSPSVTSYTVTLPDGHPLVPFVEASAPVGDIS